MQNSFFCFFSFSESINHLPPIFQVIFSKFAECGSIITQTSILLTQKENAANRLKTAKKRRWRNL